MSKRAVCLNCIDGRVQVPAIEWIKKNHDVEFVDMVTEPGMNGIVSDPGASLDAIFRKIRLSIERNSAAVIFLAGHHDCKGNPVTESEHKRQIAAGIRRLKEEFPGIPVVGIWVDENWQGQRID